MFSKKDDKLHGYIDASGDLSNNQLKFGHWYVTNKRSLTLFGVGVLVALDIALVGYSLARWGHYLFVGYMEDVRMHAAQVAEIPDYTIIQANSSAQPLQVRGTQVFSPVNGKYDFVTDVTNPNTRWVAHLTYSYAVAGGETNTAETILLPQTSRPIALFGFASERDPGAVQFRIENVTWQRVDPHAVSDVAAYMAERTAFDVNNFQFIRAGGQNDVTSHRITFDLTNASAYSYWHPVFYVDLFRAGDERVGTLFLVVPQFRAGETRTIDIRSLDDSLSVNSITIHPVINLFDPEEFMTPGQ